MKSGFASLHPFISFFYFVAILIFTMLFKHPIYEVSLLTIVLFTLFLLDRGKSLKSHLRFYLWMGLFIIILNPIFSSKGSTILFYLRNKSVSLESVVYGIIAALSLFNILIGFNIYNIIITPQKFLYLFANIIPKLSFILTITMRFIPLFQRHMREIIDVQKTLKHSSLPLSYKEKLIQSMTTLNTLVSWTLEESLENASSMRARGYGAFKRTSAIIYSFHLRDVTVLSTFIVTFILILSGFWLQFGTYTFFPTLMPLTFYRWQWLHYLLFLCFLGLPMFIEMREHTRWLFMKSKI